VQAELPVLLTLRERLGVSDTDESAADVVMGGDDYDAHPHASRDRDTVSEPRAMEMVELLRKSPGA
jgi:hypothetical protein